MILSAQLYSHMMSVDAILLNLMVPERTFTYFTWHQRRRWTQLCFCQRCQSSVVFSSWLRRWRTPLAAVHPLRWMVGLSRVPFIHLLPPKVAHSAHAEKARSPAVTWLCACCSAHGRKNPALRLVTLNPLYMPSRTNSHPSCEWATLSHGINIQEGTTVTLAETRCIVGWWHCG